MIPVPLWSLLAGGLVWAASLGGTYWFGRTDGVRIESGAQAREEVREQKAIDAATLAAADAISSLKVRYVPIREKADAVIREVPVYRECLHDARVLDAVNAALAGAGPSKLPAPDAAGRPVVRGDHGKAD